MNLQWFMAGITFTPVEPVPADDACMIYSCDATWHVDNKVRNRLMHAMMGNTFDLFLCLWCLLFLLNIHILLDSAVTVGNFVLDVTNGTETSFSNHMWKETWMFLTSWGCFFGLIALRSCGSKAVQQIWTGMSWCVRKVWKRRRIFGRCRCVGRRRTKAHRRRRRSPNVATVVCICICFIWLLLCAYLPHRKVNVKKVDKRWFTPRKSMNKRMHANNGNGAKGEITRCKWETSAELPGVELSAPDELKIPNDNMLQTIRADQVRDGACGVSFCNSLHLRPKLRVRSEEHLALLVPGKLGQDLQTLLQESNPTLKSQSFECILTLRDPVLNKRFPRQVTIINLGKELVVPADLPHTVVAPEVQTKIFWIQAWRNKNNEMWNQVVSPSLKETRNNVLQCIADILTVQSNVLDTWGFKITDDSISLCLRIQSKDADKMLNSKHPFLLARPFIAKGETYTAADDEVMVWANEIKTIPELHLLVSTLSGVLGYIGNRQGLGIRVKSAHVAAARSLLQSSSLRITNVNKNVIGTKRYIVRGFPSSTGIQQVIDLMNSKPLNQSQWKPWQVIPLKMTPVANGCTWTMKADEAPACDRLVLDGGWKLVIEKLDSPQEAARKKQMESIQKAEAAKTKRRDDFMQSHQQNPDDAWKTYLDAKGKGKTKPARSPPQTMPESDSSNDIAALKAQIGALSSRVDRQENRMDQLENTLSQQHNEVMNALRALALGSTSEPPNLAPAKRPPEMQNSPLRVESGGVSKAKKTPQQALTM